MKPDTTPNQDDQDGVLERNVTTLLETGGEPPRIAGGARARIRAHLLERHGKEARRRSPLLAVGLGLAATAAAAAIVTRVVGGGGGGGGAPVADGGKLGDGTSWITEPGARVDVVAARRVRVTGAALLDVAPGAPFVVETAAGTIEVLGTRFLVEASAERTTTAVVRGAVKLASPDGQVLLHAGEQGVAERGRPPTRGPAPRLSHLVSWAAKARAKDEAAVKPLRNGTLFAREPNRPGVPESPLPIQRLAVDVVVEDQVARVALDQTFHNPAPQVMEGMYRFAIPPDASLQRLAMYVNGTLTESAVVERMAGRRIYEDVVYRRLDPALLEWSGTGRLALRVYPLPPQEDKRLIVAYTQSLPKLYDDWTLDVPLPEVDLPVGELQLDVRVKGCANCDISSTSHAIDVQRVGEDAVVAYRKKGAALGDSLVLRVRDKRRQAVIAAHAQGDERYVMVRARPEIAKVAPAYRPRTWVILDDVSASRGPMELRAQADMIDGFLRELDEDDRVAVVAFDVTVRQKLGLTRVRDVDRPAVRRALKDEGGVGATSFAAALDAAGKLLAGVSPEDAMIVYLGDGVITSDARNLDALRAKIAGRAQLVGVGVGDGPDTQTLEALAAATGGYAATVDLADDVKWRAFDLVAALHTPRVTGIEARLVDGGGAPVPATAYVRSPQLADGEELELVARLAGGGTPVAVELTGRLGGAPWRQRIALDPGNLDNAAGREAGYLPRLWAHRHIAARLLAKHEPVTAPPCAAPESPNQLGLRAQLGRRGSVPVPVCMTDAEAREKRDEEIRQEVVALGKRYFLLSRHTSLLVLEDDAMYQRYGVTKGAGDTWAPYATPAKIPVVRTAVATDVADDAELVRSPLQVFVDYGYGYRRGARGGDVIDGLLLDDWSGNEGGGTEARFAARTRGDLGLAGPIGGGKIGTGTGFGTIGTGTFGTIGKGAGGGGRAAEPSAPPPAPEMDRLQRDSVDEDKNAEAAKAVAPSTSQPASGAEREEIGEAARRHVVTTAELMDSLHATGTGSGFGVGSGRGGFAKARKKVGGGMARITPMRFTVPDDVAFDDLTAFVPALLPDGFDAWRSTLAAGARGKAPYPIDDAARALLERARRALPAGVYRWGDRELAVDGARRLGWRRTTDADLAETASFDGRALTRRYAELGLDVVRPVADDEVALALAYLPLWIAEPAHYARWFAVRATGPRQVTLALPPRPGAQKEEAALVLDLDAQDHLVSIASGEGAELVRVAWTGAAPSAARVGGEDVPVGFTGQAIADAAAWAHGGAAPGAIVELPGRLPAYWTAKLEKLAEGSAEWHHAQRQRMAAFAAVSDRAGLLLAYEALRAHGGALRGDLVLAGSGIVVGTRDEQVAAALAPHRAASPELVRYLEAGRAYRRGRSPEALKPGAAAGLVGALGSLREIAAAGSTAKAMDRLAGMGARALDLRVIAAGVIAMRYGDHPADIARAWDAVAQGEYRNVARAQAAQVLANHARYDAAADRIAALIADLDLRATPPELASLQYMFQASRRGAAGWQLVLAQWRDKVLAGDSYEHLLAVLPFVQQRPGDLQAIFTRAAELAKDDRERLTQLAGLALQLGQPARAQAIVEPLVQRRPTRELHQLAARLAQAQGRTADALAHLEAAQSAAADEAAGLGTVRAELGAILQLARQLALQSPAGGGAQKQAVARAIAWASRWRAIDPGNAAIDQAIGELLLAVGDRAEAWRQLSTVIERDPMSGDGYQAVATAFEQQGRVAEALDYWQQAIVIDQTNPAPRLRKAQALIALGRTEEGDRLLSEIASRRWHERHEWIASQARSMLEQARQQRARATDAP